MRPPGPGGPAPAPPRLVDHLASRLGRWPPAAPFDLVGSAARERPGWDGAVCPALGVTGAGGTVLSVPPGRVAPAAARVHAHGPRSVLADLPAVVDRRALRSDAWVLRWSTAPARLPDAGVWVPADGPGVPEWLRPFRGEVLLALDDSGGCLAGVGIKRHDRYAGELAVVTSPRARGRGLGRRLVAQAARRVLDEGGVPTYLHRPDNLGSVRVAEAAGFPDRGWTAYGTVPPPTLRERVRLLLDHR